ncbi:MAG: BRO family protein [Methylorubrum populi]
MAALVPYAFEGRTLRSLLLGDEPWFIAGDVAAFLGHRDAADLKRSLDDDEKGTHRVRTPGGEQDVSVISEAGLYRAIVQRRATSAIPAGTRAFIARFQRWVFHDVLPAIRRTGTYAIPDFANPAAAARAWAEQYEARVLAERRKAEIGSRREATAMATASREAQRANRLEIELDRSGQYATVKRMEALHRGREFDWRLLKRISQQKGWLPISVPDANYVFGPGIWWSGFDLKRPGSADHALQMAS